MVRQVKHFTNLDKQISAYLKDKGIDPSYLSPAYSIERKDGLTYITVTLIAGDFDTPLRSCNETCDG